MGRMPPRRPYRLSALQRTFLAHLWRDDVSVRNLEPRARGGAVLAQGAWAGHGGEHVLVAHVRRMGIATRAWDRGGGVRWR